MKEVISIQPMSAAKVGAVLFPVLGVLFVMVVYLVYLVTIFMAGVPAGNRGTAVSESFGTYQLSPVLVVYALVLYALAGYFIGYVGAVVYNILAPRIGGIKFTMRP